MGWWTLTFTLMNQMRHANYPAEERLWNMLRRDKYHNYSTKCLPWTSVAFLTSICSKSCPNISQNLCLWCASFSVGKVGWINRLNRKTNKERLKKRCKYISMEMKNHLLISVTRKLCLLTHYNPWTHLYPLKTSMG